MPIKNLSIQNFRNIKDLHWELSPGLHVLEGENAQGKTNLLEAVYFLANGKSFRTLENSHLIQFEQEQTRLTAEMEDGELSHQLEIKLGPEGREVKLQGKPLGRMTKVNELLRVLIFTPDSATLFRGSPSARRHYFDHAIAVHRPAYSTTLNRYTRILRQRNQLLERGGEPGLLESFDFQWAENAALLMQERQAYLEELIPFWKRRLQSFLGMPFSIHAEWEGRLWELSKMRGMQKVGAGASLAVVEENPFSTSVLLDALAESQAEERRTRRTVLGPQRDDLKLTVENHLVREVASQGQQRMLVIALKLAEADLFQAKTGRSPVVLLDDLGSELDAHHLARLLGILGDIHAQTILTTAQQGVYNSLKAKTFRVSEGRLLDCKF